MSAESELINFGQFPLPSFAVSPISSADMETVNAIEEARPKQRKLSISAGIQKAIRVRARIAEIGRTKKRPLNAFMAFRSYYSPQLAGLTQKVKSGIMQKMWAAEGRKNMFALLAKAYTELRDTNRETVALEKYLAAAAELLPIIPAEDYMEKMGWELTVDAAGEKTIQRSISFSAEDLYAMYPAHTNVSVLDLVNHCYNIGLLQRSAHLDPTGGAANSMMTMPFAAAPNVGPHQVQRGPVTPPYEFNIDPDIDQYFSDIGTGMTVSADAINMRSDYRPSIETVTADQQRAFDNTPFGLHFHPQVHPPVLGFDPNTIQDDFDPFSLDFCDFLDIGI